MVGNGNVALDVARMLALTYEELAPTDATDEAIAAIAGSGIREIVVLGRRGPVQASWTSTELHEMGDLAGADIVVDPAELELDAASAAELAEASNIVPAKHGRSSASSPPASRAGKPRRIVLRFRVSPVAILGEERVEGVELVRNELVPDGEGQRARAGDRRARDARRASSSSAASAIAGCRAPACRSTSERGTMPNDGGRVLGEDGAALPGVYCAGWIKRGPTGVIGTNKKDAAETVEALLADAEAGADRRPRARRPRPSTPYLPSAGSTPSSTRAGRRSTRWSVRAASRTGGRGSSSRAGTTLLAAARSTEVADPPVDALAQNWHISVPDTGT